MAEKFSATVTIESEPPTIWATLTNPQLMTAWMGEPDMKLDVQTSWEINTPIAVHGFHQVKFENKGIILKYVKERILSYSHLSSVSRLPDNIENYTVIEFVLTPLNK